MSRAGSVVVLIAALAAGTGAPAAQTRSAAPPVEARAGGFVARRLPALPVVDGTEWEPAEPFIGGPSGTLDVAVKGIVTGPYTWRVEPSPSADTGDVERYQHSFVAAGGSPVVVDEMASWAWVTPDGRYVFREVLTVLDVQGWRQYDLSQALDISNYTFVLAQSKDHRRLLIESRSCAYACTPTFEYYEVTVPR